jgi:hypothetical protein
MPVVHVPAVGNDGNLARTPATRREAISVKTIGSKKPVDGQTAQG